MEKLTAIQCSLKAPKSQFNTFGNYKYRNCEDILEALKPLLKEHNCILTISDELNGCGERIYVKATATIQDASDKSKSVSACAYAREALTQKGMNEAQITGSTSSYARKYALNGLFLIDDTKDPDTQDNREKKEAAPVKDAKTEIYLEVLAVIKKKFPTLESKKKWFEANKITKSMKEMNETGLSNLLDLLNTDTEK